MASSQSRTRIISQSKAVYASNTGLIGDLSAAYKSTSGVKPPQLHRIDTFSFDIDIAGGRQDIREFGQLARIGTITLGDLNPSFSLGYFLGNGENEFNLGFQTNGITDADVLKSQFISGILAEDPNKREKNLYVLTNAEGKDAFATAGTAADAGDAAAQAKARQEGVIGGSFIDNPTGTYTKGELTTQDVVSFGNCNFESYTVNFAVGEIPRVDIEGTAENITFDTANSGIYNPALNKAGGRADTGQLMLGVPSTGNMDVLVLRPEDVTLTFSDGDFTFGGTDLTDMHVQSASIEVPLSRTPIEALGSAKAVAKPLDFPINVTMSVSALLKNISAGQIDKILTGNAGNETTNITLKVKGEDGSEKHRYILQKATLDNQSFSQGLDDNETIDLTFSTQIGGDNQTDQGFFYSGACTQGGIVNLPDNYGTSFGGKNFDQGFFYKKANAKAPYSSDDGAGS
tara:strand:- start:5695 stop:7068 length:1374 start_codon:yes stop_codon:yes gene_type:complete